ncbi:MlaD family protein [Chitinivibrio alkaliphilus]|uniref:Mce/MlaD domain-containing protein n=1 Tax=Chitinivibrio alkaliphilus ACht1 TaxID=1313304 RepID=U7D4Y0_9BACT|nr:MlaD family protein [Chitinivibrio alkaliphilus]ERP31574.1 hypothetical protein CALK_1436a [Chitinivibrio alkaliphilus ACht1]
MQRRKSDFSVGLIIIFALITLFAGVVFLKDVNLGTRHVTYTGLFSNIGGLQVGDPVSVNGVKMGSVRKVYLRDARVAVVFALEEGVAFTNKSQITVKNVGLLGERNLEVTLSPHGERYSPNTERDTTFVDGRFDSGIAEAIGMFGDILQQATGLVDTVEFLVSNTVASPEFLSFFDTQLQRVDGITEKTEAILGENQGDIGHIITNLRTTTETVRHIARDNEENIHAITENFSLFSERVLSLEKQLDTTMHNIFDITEAVNSKEGTVGQLIHESDLAEQLHATLHSLDSLVQVIDDDGLKLLIRMGTRRRWERE